MNASNILRKKVINILDGEILGYIEDFIIDEVTHDFVSLVIKGKNRIEFILPKEKVLTWGKEIIIVQVGGELCETKKDSGSN